MLRVELCQDSVAWDRYVEFQADACNYHRWLWRKPIEDTFGHQAQYLAAYDNGTVCGVLPLFSIRSRLFGNSLVSVPFFSYGGLLADGTEAQEALLARAVELAQETGARHIELRQGDDSVVSWRNAASKVAMYVDLSSGSEELWDR
ncbi:MAG TPA: hypothetical protein VE958_11275, partial [Bryobacteraceae bacterium]|nr:hypothetical protein [Bryobacteraceae bacterium]